MSRYAPMPARFWDKVNKAPGLGPKGECWLWTASTVRGYGNFGLTPSRWVRSHRLSWELAHGPIPGGLCVLHECDTPACVNPNHLFLGTRKDNAQDAIQKGRWYSGDRHWTRLHPERPLNVVFPEHRNRGQHNGQAILKPETVRAIRAASGPRKTIAEMFGVSKSTVYAIKGGHRWGHLS